MPTSQGSSPLTNAGVNSLTGLLEDYVRGGLGDFVFAATDLPGFLADTSPVVAAAQPTRQIVRAACRSYARGFGPQNLPGFDAVWGGICQPYLDSIGESPQQGGLARPFSGGQCPGVLYNITTTFQNPQTGEVTGVDQRQGLGPISVRSGGNQAPGSPCQNGTKYFPGKELVIQGIPRISWDGLCGNFSSLRSISVVPADGSPDECGDPPPDYQPPQVRPGLPSLPPTPVDIPGIGPVNIDVGFNPDGSLTVNLPDVGIEVPIEDPFGFGGDGAGGGGGGTPPPPPGDVGEPGQPATTAEGGEAEGEAPPGSVLVGVRVEILTVPSNRNRYTSEVYRGAYYVYMGVPGLLDLDPAGAMVRTDQFIFAEKENLTAWRVRANSKYVIRVTPYYRSVEG